METYIKHPLNAEGDFYVEFNTCTACDASRFEAPELIEYDEDFHCYFKRQPQTPGEIDHAISAVNVSCCEGVQYDGKDPNILKKIRNEFFFERFGYVEPASFWQNLRERIFKYFR